MRFTLMCSLLGMAFTVTTLAQSIPASSPQAPKVTAPGLQRPQPPSPRSSSPIARMPRRIPAPYQGTVEGFVYWDASTISHIPANSCGGLAITVSVGSGTKPNVLQPEVFTPLATVSNNFKYVGTVGNYGVCTYAYDHVPVGPDLQVQASITSPGAFSPFVLPAVQILPAKIVNGQCNNLWSLSPSVSELLGNWWTCQNAAWNVNFILQPSAHILGFSGQGGGSSGQFTGRVNPGFTGGVKPVGKAGMLSGAGTQGAHSTSLSATPAGTPPNQPAGWHGQLLPGRPGEIMPTDRPQTKLLTNADVIRMVKAGLPQSTIVSSIQSSPGNFDLSPAAQRLLLGNRVSRQIIAVMQAANSGRGASRADDLNPQPLPPHGSVATPQMNTTAH